MIDGLKLLACSCLAVQVQGRLEAEIAILRHQLNGLCHGNSTSATLLKTTRLGQPSSPRAIAASLGSDEAQRLAGDQMTLNIKRVVNSGMLARKR